MHYNYQQYFDTEHHIESKSRGKVISLRFKYISFIHAAKAVWSFFLNVSFLVIFWMSSFLKVSSVL